MKKVSEERIVNSKPGSCFEKDLKFFTLFYVKHCFRRETYFH